VSRLAVACLLAVQSVLALGAASAQETAEQNLVPVLAVLDLLGGLSPDAEDEAAAPEWLARFAGELSYPEGPHPALAVRDSLLRQGSLLSYAAGSEADAELRARAREVGARYVALAALTRVADRYSLDFRLLPAAGGPALEHRVVQSEGGSELAAAFAQGSDAMREALRSEGSGDAEVDGGAAADEVLEVVTPAALLGPPLVAEIQVAGTRRIEPDAVRAALSTRVGQPLSRERIGEDVKRVYALGFFRDVQVTATDGPDGKVVTFHVEENPIIRRVSASGNDNVGGDEIKEQLTLSVGSTIDYPLLIENKARIEQFYAQRGYYLSEVDYVIEPLGQDAVAVNFEISEGKQLKLKHVKFEGNEHLSDDELRKGLQTKSWRWYSIVSHYWDHSGVYAEPIFYQDLDRISRRYMDEGFIRVSIGEPVVQVEESGLAVSVPIEEGPQYTVGQVDVIGDETLDYDELLEAIQLKPGEVFSRSYMTGDVERLRTHYADRGFFFAKVDPRTVVDSDALTVDCIFAVEKGDLYFVDRIEVRGNTRTRDDVVRREMSLAEGELYSNRALERSRARVRRLGFFEEVSVEAKPTDDRQQVDLEVDVVERPTGSFSFGAGFGSSDGFLVNASLQQENLFGRAYGVALSADLGSENQSFFLRFANPALMGSSVSFSSTVTMSDREYDDFDQELMGFDVSLGYPLDEGETRAYTGYSFSSREVTGFDVQAASMIQREEFQEKTTASQLSLSLRRDTRDDPRFPKQGQVTGAAVEFAGLGGLAQFLRFEGRTTWFFPLKRWLGFESTFVMNSRIGWAIPFNVIDDFDLPGCESEGVTGCKPFLENLQDPEVQPLTNIDTNLELPLTERYFLGGVGPFQLRGFRRHTVGPRRTYLTPYVGFDNGNDRLFVPTNYDPENPEGCDGKCNSIRDTEIDDFDNLDLTDVIGGNKMFLLNLELQFPIAEELGLMGLLFLDMGNAFAEDQAINPADFRFGTGAGVQWFSPFGPILVQLGIPLDRLDDEDATVFEFSMGGSSY
jgi:outer membrane protein insertion porin family